MEVFRLAPSAPRLHQCMPVNSCKIFMAFSWTTGLEFTHAKNSAASSVALVPSARKLSLLQENLEVINIRYLRRVIRILAKSP